MSQDRATSGAAPRRRLALAAGTAAALGVATRPARAQPRPRTYVLIHGAWFGGWVWNPVADGLRAQGHRVYAPSLTGLGDRQHLLRPGINLDTHAEDILNLVRMEELERIVLVGWSYGGMVASDVLARIPEKVASIVYLDAFVPERGKCMLDYATRSGSVEAGMQLAVEDKDMAPLPSRSLGVTDEALAARMDAKCGPHPVMSMLQASKALPQRPPIPHTYVLAGAYAENVTTFGRFHEMFRTNPAAAAYVLPTSHVMMQTDTAGTLRILSNVG